MADRNYYVICDDNCKFEGMTKEQILAAIAEVTGATPTQIDDAFITKIKEQNRNSPLKFWVGTNAQYNELTPVGGVFYIITDADPLTDIQTQINELDAQADDLEAQIGGVRTALNLSVASLSKTIDQVDELQSHGVDELIADDNGWTVQKFANGALIAWRNITVKEADYKAENTVAVPKILDRTKANIVNMQNTTFSYVEITGAKVSATADIEKAFVFGFFEKDVADVTDVNGIETTVITRTSDFITATFDATIIGRWK